MFSLQAGKQIKRLKTDFWPAKRSINIRYGRLNKDLVCWPAKDRRRQCERLKDTSSFGRQTIERMNKRFIFWPAKKNKKIRKTKNMFSRLVRSKSNKNIRDTNIVSHMAGKKTEEEKTEYQKTIQSFDRRPIGSLLAGKTSKKNIRTTKQYLVVWPATQIEEETTTD